MRKYLCSVRGCKSTRQKKSGISIKFFNFPKNRKLCKDWIQACDRDEDININSAKICSLHFNEESYVLKDRLLNIPIEKRRLNPNAIPTEYLPRELIFWSEDEERRRKKIVEDLLFQADIEALYKKNEEKALASGSKTKVENSYVSEIEIVHVDDILQSSFNDAKALESEFENNEEVKETRPQEPDDPTKDSDVEMLEDRTETVTEGFNDITTHVHTVKTSSPCICRVNTENEELQKELEAAKQQINDQKLIIQKYKEREKQLQMKLQEIFTPGQIEKFLNTSVVRTKWTYADIDSAMRLYATGPEAYKYLYNKKYPLPGVKTLKKVSNIIKKCKNSLDASVRDHFFKDEVLFELN